MSIKDTLDNFNLQETLATLKGTLGLEPQQVDDGVYIPSESALKIAAPKTSNYDNTTYDNPYIGNKKILMVCTQEHLMTMENGNKFETGNHPIEMMVPILHFEKAGFDVDVFTSTGESVKVEQWAMPSDDTNVMTIYAEYEDTFNNPKSLAEFVANDMADSDEYVAIFIPGGHGAMLGLPEDKNLGALLRWGQAKDLLTLVICHGPAALLSANLDRPNQLGDTATETQDFIFKDYDIVAFPDVMDKQMPKLGYIPGEMPWYFNQKLEALGMTVTNKLATGHVHQDRRLISGDGPLAANDFGKLCVNQLLKTVAKS